jgi:hypothetical protein
MEIPKEILLFVVGLLAGFLNVSAGGGSTISLPALILAGLDAATANGTNRVALIMQNLSGIGSFHNQKIRGFNIALKYALLTIPGSVVGAYFSIKITQDWFEKILAVIMIGVVLTLFKKNKRGDNVNTENTNPGFLLYLSMFFIGFYGGFIQVGIGFIIMAVLFHFLKTSLVRVNFYKLIIVLVYMVPAMLVFFLHDKIDWILGLILALGTMSGAWIAAHVTVKKGDRFIRYILAIAILIMAYKLFF